MTVDQAYDSSLGRWGDGEVGGWLAGELGRWLAGEIEKSSSFCYNSTLLSHSIPLPPSQEGGGNAVPVPLQSAAPEQAVVVCLGALSTLNPIQENVGATAIWWGAQTQRRTFMVRGYCLTAPVGMSRTGNC